MHQQFHEEYQYLSDISRSLRARTCSHHISFNQDRIIRTWSDKSPMWKVAEFHARRTSTCKTVVNIFVSPR